MQNNLNDRKQSAYNKYHSAETLTKINNDVVLSMGNGEVTILVLFRFVSSKISPVLLKGLRQCVKMTQYHTQPETWGSTRI